MHLPGARVLKPVYPATKLCTPGAGCNLNFEHCNPYPSLRNRVYKFPPQRAIKWLYLTEPV